MYLIAWTSIISGADFAGIQGDVTAIGVGIVGVALVIVGIALVVRALSH